MKLSAIRGLAADTASAHAVGESRQPLAVVAERLAERCKATCAIIVRPPVNAADRQPHAGADEGVDMNFQDLPEAFGVFKPVGYVIAAFPPEADIGAAEQRLDGAGFASKDVIRYTAAQMKAQAEVDMQQASPLASLGQELNLVKSHHQLAEQGYGFLAIHAPDSDQAQQAADIVQSYGATRAQKYGRLIIEELINPGDGTDQVAESPDRGLDAQTHSGLEGDADTRVR